MITYIRQLGVAILPVLMVVVPLQARATSTDVELNLEGNPTCSSLGDNSLIQQIRDTSPPAYNMPKTVVGDIYDASGNYVGQQAIEYMITLVDGVENVSWGIGSLGEPVYDPETVYPVNYTILKSQGNAGAKVFHFGGVGQGEVKDENEGANGSITTVSFCYGLAVGFNVVEPEPEPIPDCITLVNNGDLDGTILDSCPTPTTVDPGKRLLISLDLDADNFNVTSCTCNVPDGLPVCNPELRVDAIPAAGEPGPCIVTSPVDPDEGVNEFVPVIIQGVETPNSYICYTIGGTRKCYGDF